MQLKLETIVHSNIKWMLTGQDINNFILENESRLLLQASSYKKYIYIILFLALGTARIVYLYLSQFIHINKKFKVDFNHIVGITQFGYSENLEYRYKNYFKLFQRDKNTKYHLLDEYNKKDLTRIYKISFVELWNELLLNARLSSIFLCQIKNRELIKLVLFPTLKTIALFSYTSLLFRHLKKLKTDLQFFSGGSELIANAAINEGIETYLLKHGSMSKMSKHCFLNYAHVYVYSRDDKDYINKISPNIKVSIYEQDLINTYTKKVILFFTYRDIDNLTLLQEIKDFFEEHNMELMFKFHPTMYLNEQNIITKSLNIKVIDCEMDGAEIIKEICPSFCIGWTSTALCESLYSGVIPICTQHDAEKEALRESAILYPYEKRTLNWFKDRALIRKLINKEVKYSQIHERLLNN